jgi:hypothetical protein
VVDFANTFGCLVYVHIPKTLRRKEACKACKAWNGLTLGYHDTNPTRFRIMDPASGKVRESAYCKFEERVMPLRGRRLEDLGFLG